jgi:hypothetical protein
MTVSPVLDAAGRRRSPAAMPAITRDVRRPTRGCDTPRTRRPWRGSSRSCDRPPTIDMAAHAARADRRAVARRAAHSGGARSANATSTPRVGSLLVRNGKGGRGPPDRDGRLDLKAAATVARGPRRAADRAAVLRHRRSDPRAAMVKRERVRRVPPARRPRDHPAPLSAAPATPRPRHRTRPRGRDARRDPAPARPRQPRHNQHLPAGHRHRRDHRHRARAARADNVRYRGPASLSDPKTATAGAPQTAPAARSIRPPLRRPRRSSPGLAHASPHARTSSHPGVRRRGRASARTEERDAGARYDGHSARVA